MADYRRYRVWKKGHELTLRTYRATKSFPNDERFGLTVQMRRSVSSIPTNIAEGFGRRGDKDRARFLDIAVGSANEFAYQLLLSKHLGYLESTLHDELHNMVGDVRKMLSGLLTKLRSGSR